MKMKIHVKFWQKGQIVSFAFWLFFVPKYSKFKVPFIHLFLLLKHPWIIGMQCSKIILLNVFDTWCLRKICRDLFCLFQWSLPQLSWKSEPGWTHSMWHGIPHQITHWSPATSSPVERWRRMNQLIVKGHHRPTPSGSVRRPGIISSLGWVSGDWILSRCNGHLSGVCHFYILAFSYLTSY